MQKTQKKVMSKEEEEQIKKKEMRNRLGVVKPGMDKMCRSALKK